MLTRTGLFFAIALAAWGQVTPPSGGFKERTPGPSVAPAIQPSAAPAIQVDTGTHILLSMLNSVSTRQAQVGDRIYLETAFPVVVDGKVVIPRGSWVNGTITAVQKPGHLKQKGELQIRFDTLTLANGTTRDFRGDLGSLDAASGEKLDREHNKVQGPGDGAKRAGTIATTAGAGAGIGAGVGGLGGTPLKGAGIGAAAGGAAGLIATLLSHRPDAMLMKGASVEMVLDRPLVFSPQDLER